MTETPTPATTRPRLDDSRLLDIQMGLFARLAEKPMSLGDIAQAFDLAPHAAEALIWCKPRSVLSSAATSDTI